MEIINENLAKLESFVAEQGIVLADDIQHTHSFSVSTQEATQSEAESEITSLNDKREKIKSIYLQELRYHPFSEECCVRNSGIGGEHARLLMGLSKVVPLEFLWNEYKERRIRDAISFVQGQGYDIERFNLEDLQQIESLLQYLMKFDSFYICAKKDGPGANVFSQLACPLELLSELYVDTIFNTCIESVIRELFLQSLQNRSARKVSNEGAFEDVDDETDESPRSGQQNVSRQNSNTANATNLFDFWRCLLDLHSSIDGFTRNLCQEYGHENASINILRGFKGFKFNISTRKQELSKMGPWFQRAIEECVVEAIDVESEMISQFSPLSVVTVDEGKIMMASIRERVYLKRVSQNDSDNVKILCGAQKIIQVLKSAVPMVQSGGVFGSLFDAAFADAVKVGIKQYLEHVFRNVVRFLSIDSTVVDGGSSKVINALTGDTELNEKFSHFHLKICYASLATCITLANFCLFCMERIKRSDWTSLGDFAQSSIALFESHKYCIEFGGKIQKKLSSWHAVQIRCTILGNVELYDWNSRSPVRSNSRVSYFLSFWQCYMESVLFDLKDTYVDSTNIGSPGEYGNGIFDVYQNEGPEDESSDSDADMGSPGPTRNLAMPAYSPGFGAQSPGKSEEVYEMRHSIIAKTHKNDKVEAPVHNSGFSSLESLAMIAKPNQWYCVSSVVQNLYKLHIMDAMMTIADRIISIDRSPANIEQFVIDSVYTTTLAYWLLLRSHKSLDSSSPFVGIYSPLNSITNCCNTLCSCHSDRIQLEIAQKCDQILSATAILSATPDAVTSLIHRMCRYDDLNERECHENVNSRCQCACRFVPLMWSRIQKVIERKSGDKRNEKVFVEDSSVFTPLLHFDGNLAVSFTMQNLLEVCNYLQRHGSDPTLISYPWDISLNLFGVCNYIGIGGKHEFIRLVKQKFSILDDDHDRTEMKAAIEEFEEKHF